MLSKRIRYSLTWNSPMQPSIDLWKETGALQIPNVFLLHVQEPRGHTENVVFILSDSSISI